MTGHDRQRIRTVVGTSLSIGVAIGLLTGCYVAPPRARVVASAPVYPGPAVVAVSPPPARVEVIPPRPGERFIWDPGHWRWGGNGYVWEPGHYIEGRGPGFVWVPGHWAARNGGWFWIEGHWRG
jgi:hypothetical protein